MDGMRKLAELRRGDAAPFPVLLFFVPGFFARSFPVITIVIICIVASGCAVNGGSRAPVESGGTSRPATAQRAPERFVGNVPALYRVRSGDTLYAIAWRYGFDFRDLARWNLISQPYTIFPEQPLVLSNRGLPSGKSPVDRQQPTPGARPHQRRRPGVVGPRSQRRPGWIEARHGLSKVRPQAASSAPRTEPTSSSDGATGADSDAPVRAWQWPTKGRILRSFSATKRNGIDIAGVTGQAVVAAANGRVVYAGTGLRGYGRLVIIKHNQRFLSAYAHNAQLDVAEGDAVRKGQRIGNMGSTGTDRVMLHFEIRRDGKPVNPVSYLP
jgi:lipoprotein NlpD